MFKCTALGLQLCNLPLATSQTGGNDSRRLFAAVGKPSALKTLPPPGLRPAAYRDLQIILFIN
jgi:hypothetical protein